MFSAELSVRAGVEHYRQVKASAAAAGRDPAHVHILPGLITVIGGTDEQARRRDRESASLAPDTFAQQRLSATLGVDVSALELDAPLPRDVIEGPPDPRVFNGSLGFRESVVWLANEEKYTVRELIDHLAGGAGHRKIVGSPEQVADTIERWYNAGAADGFNLMPDRFPDGLDDFVDHVVPILRRRGLFRHEYAEHTLRDRWSLPTPTRDSRAARASA